MKNNKDVDSLSHTTWRCQYHVVFAPKYRRMVIYGYKSRRVNSSYGSMDIDVPQDRKSTFEPQIVKKRQKDISDIDQKIISMYAKGMTTRQISETIEDIYGFETSEGFISDVTDKILPQIEDWQNRPLDEVYPILYIDAIHYSVRDNGVIRKLAAYVILGINTEGKKEVLSITVGDNESSKYWLSVLNELKKRLDWLWIVLLKNGPQNTRIL